MVQVPGGEWSAASFQVVAEHGVQVCTSPVRRVVPAGGTVTIDFADDTTLDVAALFVQPRQAPRNELARQLGCDVVEDGPSPGLVTVDTFGRTSVPGVFAAGDLVTGMQQVWIAATAGGVASLMAHRELVAEGFPFD
jgi:thioredoxin reductase